jgi:AcrR family transcriptional regulator
MAPSQHSKASPPVPTRDLLLDEAERLIAKKGVNGFTLKDVVAPLGVQVPSIYKHYTSRDDVMIALSRRYISQLARHFSYLPEALENPTGTLRDKVLEYARFHANHPAYVRLALVDFATPDGGMEYLRLAAGGPFRANVSRGPLAAMHRRLRRLIAAGHRKGEFRLVSPVDFFRIVKGALLLRLVFPDDLLVEAPLSRGVMRSLEAWVWDIAYHYTASRPSRPRSLVKPKSEAGITADVHLSAQPDRAEKRGIA